ncbi:quinone oxidoreductase-like protein 2 homolog [Bacillus rossius redtenbacheri]|uniref:quinone oxidoreductase-like protein 2 homolog n=1 Tax=Bacillus rossius redtenbacheri TaxID=93214 RepID=UPI002FDCFC9D
MATVLMRKSFNFVKQPQLQISAHLSDSNKNAFRAAVLNDYGKELTVQERLPEKKLNKGEIRLKVKYCSINASDVLICSGKYDVMPKVPLVPGYELFGEVIELGPGVDDDDFSVGESVIALNKEHFSGLAEQCVLSTKDAWVVPSVDKPMLWCGLADSYATALIGLARRGHLKTNNTILVTAAGGGLGLAAVDIAANVYKAKVIAVCESEDKADTLRGKGAWAALKFSPKDIKKKVQDVTEGKGVDIIFDSVGNASMFQDSVNCVAHEGKVIVAGAAARQVKEVKTSLLLPKSFSLIGVSLHCYRNSAYKIYRQIVQDAIDMFEQGLVSPHIAKTFTLNEVNEALKYVGENVSTGQVIIDMHQ